MGLAIPTWMFDDDFRPMLFAMVGCSSIALALYLYSLSNSIMNNCSNGISISSKLEMAQMIKVILAENDK